MVEYLIELYVSRTDAELGAGESRSIREAAEQLTRQGRPMPYRHSIFVPADETCFVLIEADSVNDVYDATRLAALPSTRVSRAVSYPERKER